MALEQVLMLELLYHVLQGDPSTPLPGRKLSAHFYTCQHPTQCPALFRGSTEKCGVIESGKKGSEHGEKVSGETPKIWRLKKWHLVVF